MQLTVWRKSKFYYYYLRDADKHPRVTVVLVHHEDSGLVYRGVSICSYKDNPCKYDGKMYALARIINLISAREDRMYPINRSEAHEVLLDCGEMTFRYKAEKFPLLSDLEEYLLFKDDLDAKIAYTKKALTVINL